MIAFQIFAALVFGVLFGILIVSLMRANDKPNGDDAKRMDFVQGESIFISRGGDYIVVYDARDQSQLAIHTDLRVALDEAAAKMLALVVARKESEGLRA